LGAARLRGLLDRAAHGDSDEERERGDQDGSRDHRDTPFPGALLLAPDAGAALADRPEVGHGR
jgi:hypothetical protein